MNQNRERERRWIWRERIYGKLTVSVSLWEPAYQPPYRGVAESSLPPDWTPCTYDDLTEEYRDHYCLW